MQTFAGKDAKSMMFIEIFSTNILLYLPDL
jgi:hypothetical protein